MVRDPESMRGKVERLESALGSIRVLCMTCATVMYCQHAEGGDGLNITKHRLT